MDIHETQFNNHARHFDKGAKAALDPSKKIVPTSIVDPEKYIASLKPWYRCRNAPLIGVPVKPAIPKIELAIPMYVPIWFGCGAQAARVEIMVEMAPPEKAP